MTSNLHFEIMPKAQQKAWNVLKSESDKINDLGFYLAGGTALALQIGHRRSVDFDFFSTKKGFTSSLRSWLEKLPGVVLRELSPNTAHVDLAGVKLSFIGAYKYPIVHAFSHADGIKLASVLDIALMKLLAITHRAALRDYIDVAAIVRDHVPLSVLIQKSRKKYGSAFNPMLPLKALVAFEDLDGEMPLLIDKSLAHSWKKILLDSVKKTAA